MGDGRRQVLRYDVNRTRVVYHGLDLTASITWRQGIESLLIRALAMPVMSTPSAFRNRCISLRFSVSLVRARSAKN